MTHITNNPVALEVIGKGQQTLFGGLLKLPAIKGIVFNNVDLAFYALAVIHQFLRILQRIVKVFKGYVFECWTATGFIGKII